MSKKDESWIVEKLRSTVHVIRFDDVKQGWRQAVLLTADRHHDNLHTNQKLEKKHLELARARNAPIIDIGDLFCAMQGKYDPRKSYSNIRPEHVGDDYFDLLQDTAAEFYAPYADLFAVIGTGNHEASVLKRNQVNLTKGLVRRLRYAADIHNMSRPGPFLGDFAGWVFFRFIINKTVRKTIRLKYHHGYGGGGEVTKGVIQTNRRAVYLPDADIITTGHIHESWIVPLMRERINNAGVVSLEPQWHISLPTYKEEYGPQSGFHIMKGRPPKPVGAVWLWFEYFNKTVNIYPEIDI